MLFNAIAMALSGSERPCMGGGVMGQDYPKQVQIEGEDRDRMRSLLEEAGGTLSTMGELILDQVHGKEIEKSRPKVAVLVFDNTRGIIYDGQHCGVHDEEHGISRPCTPEELKFIQSLPTVPLPPL
jgi:hypothetical protein